MSEPLQEVIYEGYPAWKTRKMKAGHRCLNKKKNFDGLFLGIHVCGWTTKETKTKFMVPDRKRS